MAFESQWFVGAFEVIGVIMGLIGLFIGMTKGRQALKLTGGGVVAITVKYLLIATVLFVTGFAFKAFGFLADFEFAAVIGSIIMFGEGICFFIIFWELAKHMEQLKTYM